MDLTLNKLVYLITGKTNSGKYVTTGWCSEERIAIEEFVNKYPRFKGCAFLRKKIVEDAGNYIFISDGRKEGEMLARFTCKNDILQHINGRFVLGASVDLIKMKRLKVRK